ncbi:hypothetical protein [Histidinibacterium aquaticum]|uniref:Uncharacterized protein n=1 Tax=Histidinibacterium aquaticum TaxID=2613962 RepID=A0A5J5GC92_9RHOB|nr:hypothetical protein [Histidinibacterium aquaticum]KAA9005054.1 hypothetical protein F3S47_18670 [Histidinibacterium aquaticum]
MSEENCDNGGLEPSEEQPAQMQAELEKCLEREKRLRSHYEKLAQRYDLLEEAVESRMRHRLGQSETRIAKLSRSLTSAHQKKKDLTTECRQLSQAKGELEKERKRLEHCLQKVQQEADFHRRDAENLRGSLSWRSTAPLRWVKRLVSRT